MIKTRRGTNLDVTAIGYAGSEYIAVNIKAEPTRAAHAEAARKWARAAGIDAGERWVMTPDGEGYAFYPASRAESLDCLRGTAQDVPDPDTGIVPIGR